MAIPLTADELKVRIRHAAKVMRDDPRHAWLWDPNTGGGEAHVVSHMLHCDENHLGCATVQLAEHTPALLDALDAREGQTCGTCRSFVRDGDEEAVVPTGWCRDTHDQPMQHSTTHAQFGCNQWTPKEPQP